MFWDDDFVEISALSKNFLRVSPILWKLTFKDVEVYVVDF
jgi:hypothetical protein